MQASNLLIEVLHKLRPVIGRNGLVLYTGKGYTIFPDGRYTFVSAGAMNQCYSRTESAGRVFVNNEMVFRESGGKSEPLLVYQLRHRSGGSTLLTLLPAVYEPEAVCNALLQGVRPREPEELTMGTKIYAVFVQPQTQAAPG